MISWHPGGAAAIIGHAGKVHQETSDDFASVHDGFAYQKLGGNVSSSSNSLAFLILMKQSVFSVVSLRKLRP